MPDRCVSDNKPELLGHQNRHMFDLKDECVQCMDYMGLGGKVDNVPGRLVRGLANFSLVFAYLFCMNLPGYCLVDTIQPTSENMS